MRKRTLKSLPRVTGVGPGLRVYALAKELKLDNKTVIADARREGIDVQVPSQKIPYHVAERIRHKYFPLKPRQDMRPRLIKANREYIALTQIGERIRVVSLRSDGTYSFLDDAQNLHNIVYIASSETLRLIEAIDELESLANNSNAKEKDFQDFFERNQSFILNDEYKRAHSHLVLSNDQGSTLVRTLSWSPIIRQPCATSWN